MSPEQAEKMLSTVVSGGGTQRPGQLLMDRLIDREADKLMETLFGQLGHDLHPVGTAAGTSPAKT